MAKINFLKLLLRVVLALLPVVKSTLVEKAGGEDATAIDEVIDSVITVLEQFTSIL